MSYKFISFKWIEKILFLLKNADNVIVDWQISPWKSAYCLFSPQTHNPLQTQHIIWVKDKSKFDQQEELNRRKNKMPC